MNRPTLLFTVAMALLATVVTLGGCAKQGFDVASLEAAKLASANNAPLPIWQHTADRSGGE